jgi:antitoxin (DNA-binding transcriptional repressor) of toxin-antitoxin stability system
MEDVSIRQLRLRFCSYLEAVRHKGRSFTIRHYEHPFAVIVPLKRYLELIEWEEMARFESLERTASPPWTEAAEREPSQHAPISLPDASGPILAPEYPSGDTGPQIASQDEETDEEEEIDEVPLPDSPFGLFGKLPR